MGAKEFSWNAIDRQHEDEQRALELFDAALIEEMKRQAAAMRTNALTGHEQTLSDLAKSVRYHLGGESITETLIRTALISPLAAGQMFQKMAEKCIEADAETAGLVELERTERAGGLDVAAMRASVEMSEFDVRVPA